MFGRPFRRPGRDREVLQEVRKGSGGPPVGSGGSLVGSAGIWRPSRWSGTGREVLL